MQENNLYRNELKTLRKYVAGKSIEAVKEEFGLDYVNKLASNENPLGPSQFAVDAMVAEASNVHIYPDPSAGVLTEKLSAHLKVRPSQLILGNGGEEVLKMIAMTFINPGDEAIMAKPTFGLYQSSVTLMGGTAIEIDLTADFEHDFNAFYSAITSKTKMIYICNPNNPTGNIMSKDKIDAFMSKIPKHILVVFDEAYFEFACVNASYPNGLDYLSEHNNIVVLRTFSKVAGLAGGRVGYAISTTEHINEMKKVKGVFNVSRIAQAGAVGALQDDNHLTNTVKLNYDSLDEIQAFCDKNELDFVPSGANFIFMKTPIKSDDLFIRLQREGVVIRPGVLWGYNDWIRVSTGTLEQTDNFIETMSKVLAEF